MRMLLRLHPIPASCAEAVRLTVKSFEHDFGTYREVCVVFDAENRQAIEYACGLESDGPAEWDAIARYELLWHERRAQYQRALYRGDLRADEVPAEYLRGQPPTLAEGPSLAELLAAHPL